ncbi:MAG: phosphate acyltransferase PlsX [Firmicutes bacterium]|nr:phosphate acyltransferase PlsX [Bacillota bacterium]
MRIALDTMGGDFAPSETVRGALLAVEELGIEVILVGDSKEIESELCKDGTGNRRLSIVHAGQVIPMNEPHPVDAIRKMRDSSILTACDLVAQGDADAVVSAGNTGATMISAISKLRRLEGSDRPAIATVFPTTTGYCLIVDAGANSECRPHHMLSFALMGDAYARQVMSAENPRLGLLNVGEESTKGTKLTIASYELIKSTNCNFIGNIEAKDIPLGRADVVVTDGFTGNVVLKLAEGLGEAMMRILAESMGESPVSGTGLSSAHPALQSLAHRMDYSEYGGALLLGVRGVTVIAHGRSRAKAIKNAIGTAKAAVEGNVTEAISDRLGTGGSERRDKLES